LSLEEMRHQLGLQNAMDTLDFAKLDPSYAEDGSALGKDFRLWYRSAAEPTDQLISAMRDAGVLEDVDFVRVPLNMQDLLDEAVALAQLFRESKIDVGVTIDTLTGGVQFHSNKSTDSASRADAENAADARKIPYFWGDPTPTPANYGGKNFELPNGNCTGGFVVAKDGAGRRISTAGHCGTTSHTGVYGGDGSYNIKTSTYTWFRDFATANSLEGGVSWTAEVKYTSGGLTRSVNSRQLDWADTDIGDPVSKYGRTTGYTSGIVSDTHACSPAACDPEALFVEVEPVSTYPNMCLPGDSGGPFMWENKAFGFTSGYSGNVCVYMPQQFTDNGWRVAVG
jgi:hypothetical protein